MGGVDCIVHYVPASEGARLQALLRSIGVARDWSLAPNVQQSVKSANLSDLLSSAFTDLSARYRYSFLFGQFTGGNVSSCQRVIQKRNVYWVGHTSTKCGPCPAGNGGCGGRGRIHCTRYESVAAPVVDPLTACCWLALDGGYVLLSLPASLSSRSVDLFADVRWSTEDTMRDQVACIEATGCTVLVGPMYVDIDSPEDARTLLDICNRIVAEGGDVPCPESFRVLGMHLEPSGLGQDGH